jgi:hypothetical protein
MFSMLSQIANQHFETKAQNSGDLVVGKQLTHPRNVPCTRVEVVVAVAAAVKLWYTALALSQAGKVA